MRPVGFDAIGENLKVVLDFLGGLSGNGGEGRVSTMVTLLSASSSPRAFPRTKQDEGSVDEEDDGCEREIVRWVAES